CHVKGGDQIYEAFRRHLSISGEEDTDSKKLFTVEKIACLGCCTLAPAVKIGEVTYGHLTPETIPTVLSDFLRYEEAKASHPPKTHKRQIEKTDTCGELRIGLGSCCVSRGSGKLHEALEQTLTETGIRAAVKRVGCVGMCYQTPLLEVVLPDNKSFLYAKVQPEDARAIVLKHFKPKQITRKIRNTVSTMLDKILTDQAWEPVTRYSIDVRDQHVADFLDKQKHIATEYCGFIDPVDLDEYVRNDGFNALKKCVNELSPEQIITEIGHAAVGVGPAIQHTSSGLLCTIESLRRNTWFVTAMRETQAPLWTGC
ncbi:MAG: NAD(P)H-dependent oxidoreductase subunit E, partial [Planctomycetota bacterium]